MGTKEDAPSGGPPAEVTDEAARVTQLEKELTEARAALETRSNWQVRFAEGQRKLTDSETVVARLRAAEAARTQTAAALAESGLPEPAYAKVVSAVVGHEGRAVPLTEANTVDGDKLKTSIEAAIAAEKTYIASLAESGGAGRPRDLGGTTGDPDPKALDADLAAVFADLGLTESGAKLAATGRG